MFPILVENARPSSLANAIIFCVHSAVFFFFLQVDTLIFACFMLSIVAGCYNMTRRSVINLCFIGLYSSFRENCRNSMYVHVSGVWKELKLLKLSALSGYRAGMDNVSVHNGEKY